jgi:predicted nicotinamide N-methyase
MEGAQSGIPSPVSPSSLSFSYVDRHYSLLDYDFILSELSTPELLFVCSSQHPSFSSHCFTGLQTWSGTEVLCRLLISRPQLVIDSHVIELGAGTGMNSILAACINQRVNSQQFQLISTDGEPESLELIKRNFSRNFTSPFVDRLKVESFNFGISCAKSIKFKSPGRSLIIGSELIYQRVDINALVNSIAALLNAQQYESVSSFTGFCVLVHTARQAESQEKMRSAAFHHSCIVKFAPLTNFLSEQFIQERFWGNLECVWIYREKEAQAVEQWASEELKFILNEKSHIETREEQDDEENIISRIQWEEED